MEFENISDLSYLDNKGKFLYIATLVRLMSFYLPAYLWLATYLQKKKNVQFI